MHCPFCGHTETKVIDSRLAGEGRQIRRRRRNNLKLIHLEKRALPRCRVLLIKRLPRPLALVLPHHSVDPIERSFIESSRPKRLAHRAP